MYCFSGDVETCVSHVARGNQYVGVSVGQPGTGLSSFSSAQKIDGCKCSFKSSVEAEPLWGRNNPVITRLNN